MLKLVKCPLYLLRCQAASGNKLICRNFAVEPNGPAMKTAVPGPESLKIIKESDSMHATSQIRFVADYENSFGNYITDVDGNQMMDMLNQISSLPIGYNHPEIVKLAESKEFLTASFNRAALGFFPPKNYHKSSLECLMKVAPKGLNRVQPMMCGSCAVENALKAAYNHYMTKQRDGKPPTEEDIDSVLLNKQPGSSNMSILSFRNGFHGRTLGALSCTRTKYMHKLDFPAFNWPMADFPSYKYDLEEHADYNAKQDEICLSKVEETIDAWKSKSPVCAVIVEPILSEGGDLHASNSFFTKLRDICLKKNVTFIVDEVQTGGGPTGEYWAHKYWNLTTPPDIVTFAKRLMIGGYFTTAEYIPKTPYRIFNTWLGDHSKSLILEQVINVIEKDKLLERVKSTGTYFLSGLKDLQKQSNGQLQNARGKGIFCAIDCVSTAERDKFISKFTNAGILVAGCGEKAIRFRPSLIIEKKHVDIALDTMLKVVKN